MPETTTKTNLTQIGTIVVPVTNQDRALAFYSDHLGCELRDDIPMGDPSGMRWIEVGHPGKETTIALFPPRPGDPVGVETHIFLSSSDVHADHAALKAARVDVDDEVSEMGEPVPPMFWLRDPDGNNLCIVKRD